MTPGLRKSAVSHSARRASVGSILLEAALVSLLAGFLGYAVCMGGARLALPFMAESKNAHLVWEAGVAFGSIGLALTLGLLASLYPALHASKMDPTEALRAL